MRATGDFTRSFAVNGEPVSVAAAPEERLTTVLRDRLGLTGTKVGCDAGDCGACTVLLDGAQVCACLVPFAQVEGRTVTTVEGLARDGRLGRLQRSFHEHGAAQCGICTPGMLMAASTLLDREPMPSEEQVLDALGGVLCRCTGYRKIVQAVLAAAESRHRALEPSDCATYVGRRLDGVDGIGKVNGETRYGADTAPADALWLRVVRSPHAHACFVLGDLAPLHARYPGLRRVLTATDVPGVNGFGIYPTVKDQPVLAPGVARYRGEAVLALVGERETIEQITDDELPIEWELRPAVSDPASALAPNAPPINPDQTSNVLTRGCVRCGELPAGGDGLIEAHGEWTTTFIEHAYIEPEAGYARPIEGDRIEVVACTQTPYMDRDEVANVLGIAPERVRVRPSACGGGFGGKLDQSVQPLLGLAAWVVGAPVRCVYRRVESMAATTKRHPAQMRSRALAHRDGTLVGFEFDGDFDTGAYASWGPTVAGRVPVHCMGPYRVPNVRAEARAVFTHRAPAGAFRGFGVPQAAIAHEALMDELALRCGRDPLEFRLRNALRVGDRTATGQRLEASVGLSACLEALRPRWRTLRSEAERFNRSHEGRPIQRGVGIACMWYGCGNTSMSNPSSMRVTLTRDARVVFYNGAQDIGQGSSTILLQIMAQALGLSHEWIEMVVSDTDLTEDAGKSSASRQTFVSGRATQLAGEDLRAQILKLANVGEGASLEIASHRLTVIDGAMRHPIALDQLPVIEGEDVVLVGRGQFDPPSTPLDENGQGIPYATYGFAAQIASVAVDVELGTVKVDRIVAAHDVGAAVNPTLVEGQIEGGIAQGIGFAMMEEFIPGRTENLHDYLIPTIGDVPEIECLLIEDPEPLGPYGAKGIGEPALIPTAPAILNAVYHATGVRLRRLPILPHRVREAIEAQRGDG